MTLFWVILTRNRGQIRVETDKKASKRIKGYFSRITLSNLTTLKTGPRFLAKTWGKQGETCHGFRAKFTPFRGKFTPFPGINNTLFSRKRPLLLALFLSHGLLLALPLPWAIIGPASTGAINGPASTGAINGHSTTGATY